MSKPTKETGTSKGRPATEDRKQREQTRANVIYDGEHVVVRERNGFYNAYVRNDPDLSQADLIARALRELTKKRKEIDADGIIWLRGPGFRLGVPPDGRVIIMPNFKKKAILLDNIVKLVKRLEQEE